jgi:hypothetical protein
VNPVTHFLVSWGVANSAALDRKESAIVTLAAVLRRIGIKASSTRSFLLADGTSIKRRMGEVSFRIYEHAGTSPVIFGQKEDTALLGSVSLGVLGFFLEPLKRELRPLPMNLASTLGPAITGILGLVGNL